MVKSPFLSVDYAMNKALCVPIMKLADFTTELITKDLADRNTYLNWRIYVSFEAGFQMSPEFRVHLA